ncbi:MAG: class I tRNA ligase family protein, partial [bacterium]|nr:class I tRNA ligase family protein [bacterium]
MKKFYLTTAIDYVNNLPHLGTAYEKIGAGVLAHFLKMEGREVHLQMGNDEHSEGVKKAAEEKKLEPKVYCDQMRKKFEAIWKDLGIGYDDFVQTSEKRHVLAVETLIRAIKKTDIYKEKYEGWYCDACEAFYTEKDLMNGECPNHKKKPQWLSEENYFFRLSHYQDDLLKLYAEHPEFILPVIRRNEVLNFVKGGLQDISISRSSF